MGTQAARSGGRQRVAHQGGSAGPEYGDKQGKQTSASTPAGRVRPRFDMPRNSVLWNLLVYLSALRFSLAVQLISTLIGKASALIRLVLTRNRCPFAVTS